MGQSRRVVAAPAGLLALTVAGCATSIDTAKLQGTIQAKLAAADLAASSVACPPSIEVKAGSTFDCTATVDGVPVKVVVTQKDDAGSVSFETDPRSVLRTENNLPVIQQAIRDRGATDVSVSCPKAVVLTDGTGSFTCTATADGQALKVSVPVRDGQAGAPSIDPA